MGRRCATHRLERVDAVDFHSQRVYVSGTRPAVARVHSKRLPFSERTARRDRHRAGGYRGAPRLASSTAWISRLIPAVRRNDPMPPGSWLTLIGLDRHARHRLARRRACSAGVRRFPIAKLWSSSRSWLSSSRWWDRASRSIPVLRLLRISEEGGEEEREVEIRCRH